jgi:hypothetical protein
MEMRVSDLVEVFVVMAAMCVFPSVFLWLIEFSTEPEQALERLGRLVAAFRRGLAGKPSGRVENAELPAGTGSRPPE